MRARYPDEEGRVENDGVGIFYELFENDAPTLLLMPPVAFSHSYLWKGAVPYLSRHFRLLTFDGRGNGKSDRPADAGAYAPECFVADALAVMDHTATDRAIVVALGPRAICGVRLAVDHRARVAGLALLAPDLFADREFADAWRAGPQEHYSGIDAFNPQLMRSDWPAFLEVWSRAMFPHPHSSRQIEDMIAYGLETDGDTFIASTIGTRYPPREAILDLAHRLDCPCVVTQWGQPMWPVRTSDTFAEASGSPLVVFEGLGPAVAARWPVATNLLLREFAESIRDGREPRYTRWDPAGAERRRARDADHPRPSA